MNPLSVGKLYCLRLPDGRILGHVRVRRLEEPWAEGSFKPGTAFTSFRDLFEREARLRHDQVIPLWEDAADAIDALQIQVVEEGGQHPVQPRLRVCLEGDEAFLGGPA